VVDNAEGDSVACVSGTDEIREDVLLNPLSPCVVLEPKAFSNERSVTPALGSGWLGAAGVAAAATGERLDEKASSNENGLDSMTGGREGRPSTADAAGAKFVEFCRGINAFSKPDPAGEDRDLVMPLELVGGGGKAVEPEGDAATTGVETFTLSLPKSNSASNPGSSAAVGSTFGKLPNASLKSVRPATFAGSEGAANGEVAAAKALAFCVGPDGNGLLF